MTAPAPLEQRAREVAGATGRANTGRPAFGTGSFVTDLARRLQAGGVSPEGASMPPMPTSPTILLDNDLLRRLEAAIAAAGSAEVWASQHGISASFVSETRSRQRPFSPRMLTALGVELVRAYRVVEGAAEGGAASALSRLTRRDRQVILWLRPDGAPRKRQDVEAGGWRPLHEDLRRLAALRLGQETPEGWAATAAGQEMRAAIEADGARGGEGDA